MPEPTVYQALRETFLSPPLTDVDLSGKTVIVLGANVGIGFEATKHFARMNPGKLILACRSQEKGEAALARIKEETGCQTLEVWVIDLSQMSSVVSFAERFQREGGRLDILLANAGILTSSLEFTDDGWELTCQVNYLANSLLCLLLIPRMLETSKMHETTPRVVIVSSGMHYRAQIEKELITVPHFLRSYCHKDGLTDRSGKEPDFGAMGYAKSKLLGVFFVRSLNARLEGKPLIVNLADPGLCQSSIARNTTGILRWFFAIAFRTFARTAEVGSRPFIFASVGAEDKKDELRGVYINPLSERVTSLSDYVESEDGHLAQEKIWDDLLEELSAIEPKVKEIVQQYLQ